MQIQLKKISKFYKVYKNQNDILTQLILNKFEKFKSVKSKLYKESWALKDIDLEINKGESIGIIGKNGSGKSTLLQIIAGTISPSNGFVKTDGRITSLIELGSGFNLEFTGKENIFLNGLILGFSRKEVQEKYDEILSFADIGDYVNLPVKTYSTGMLMRLAFSVQTSFEPDILIVDEALSVGDIFFQAKCVNRMKNLRDQGATLLFVSHSMSSVREICDKALLLDNGRMRNYGKTKSITDEFLLLDKLRHKDKRECKPQIDKKFLANESTDQIEMSKIKEVTKLENIYSFFDNQNFKKNGSMERYSKNLTEIKDIKVFDENLNLISNIFEFNQLIKIRVLIELFENLNNINLTVKIRTKMGVDLIHCDTFRLNKKTYSFKKGEYIFGCDMKMPLQHGDYFIALVISEIKGGTTTGGSDLIEVINSAYFFTMNPKREGMIGGYVGLLADMKINPT
tara:strand:- start:24510 stop:25874 length:1365 start_codon:yes stop_codon:yes gene_type:complete